MKKGSLELDTLGKIIIMVIVVLALVIIAFLLKDKIVLLIQKAATLMRFKS